MPSISPLLAVDDVGKSMDYYERVLGFRKGLALPDESGRITHGEVHIGDLMIMLGWAGQTEGPFAAKLAQGGARGVGVLLYLDLGDQDIDRYHEDVKRAGANVVVEIADEFWGDRTFMVEDGDGYLLTFAQHVREVDVSEMQAAALH